MSPEEGRSFFEQLLFGLLHNLQPLQGPGETQLHSSPLREASKDILASACQVLGPTAFLHQVLQSVTGLGTQSASLNPKQLEVSLNHVSRVCSMCKGFLHVYVLCRICCHSMRLSYRDQQIVLQSCYLRLIRILSKSIFSLKYQDITVLVCLSNMHRLC